jgi:WD40 repeat protein
MAKSLLVIARVVLLVVGLGAVVGSPAIVGGEPALQLVLQTGHTSQVTSVALSDDGKYLVTGSGATRPGDGSASLWEMSTGKRIQTFQGHTHRVTSVAISEDGKHVVTGSWDSTAILWETSSGKRIQTFVREQPGLVWSVAISGDGKHVVMGSEYWDGEQLGKMESEDKTVTLWEAFSGKKLRSLEGHTRAVTKVALSVDGKRLVTGSNDNTVFLWDTSNGKKVQTFQGHAHPITSVALSWDGKQLVTASWDQTTILWEASSGKKLRVFRGQVWSVAMSADGNKVVTGSEDGTATLWEVSTGKQRLTFRGHSSPVRSVALSTDGRYLWTASDDGTTRLWDALSGKELCRLLSLDAGKDWLVVSPDGFFDGSKGGWRYISYRRPDTLQLIDDEATLRKFYRPGLMGLLLKGTKIAK